MDTVNHLGNEASQLELSNPRNKQANNTSASDYPGQALRRLAGLNPFKTTYFALYDSLDTLLDRSIAWSGVFFAIAAGVPLPVIGLIFGKIINNFPPTEAEITARVSQLLGVAVAYFVVTAIYATTFGITSEKVSVKLRERLLNALLHLDQAYLDTHDLDVNSLITEKIDIIQAGTSEKVGIFVQSMSYFVAAFTVGFILDARLTGILLASVIPAISVAFLLLSPLVSKFSRATAKSNEKANHIVENALRAVRVVQAYDMIGAICKQHLDIVDASSRLAVKKALLSALQTGLIFFIAYSANALAFFLGSREVDGGNAGTVYAVVFLIIDASFVVGQFAPFLEIFTRAAAARSTIQELFDAEAESIRTLNRSTDTVKPELFGRDVTFENVTFAYPARTEVNALEKINLTIRAGQFTTLVGTSGGGKSTLVSLLLGAYDFDGHIKIGEHDIRQIESAYRRSQIGVLEQDCLLFSGTIFDNICFGLIGQDLSESEKAARCDQAIQDAAVDFLDLLPKGVHTRVSNEMQMSGGQRQRICLARALIKKPALLILDEPTSALDARSELLVMEAVRRAAAAGTTIIMVAHRLSTTLDADHVIVMGEGKVLEEGSPGDLSRSQSVFSKLLQTQSTSYMIRQESADSAETLFAKLDGPDHEKDGMEKTVSLDDGEAERAVVDKPAMGLWTVLKRLGGLIRPDAFIVVLGVAGSIAAGGILLGESVVFGSLVQLLNNPNGVDRNSADLYCLIFFILGLVALISYITSGSSFGITSARMTGSLQARALSSLLHLDIQWFSQPSHSVHDLMAAFTKDPGDLSSLSGIALGTIFTVITSVFGGIILAHVIAWKIAIVLLAAVPVMIVAGFLRLRTLSVSEIRHREAYREATNLAAEACRSRKTVAALGMEQHLLEEYRQALRKPFREIRRFTFISSTLLAFCLAISYFVYALAYWWGSKQVRDGMYSTRQFFTVLPAMLFSAQAAGQLFSLSPEIARAKTAAKSVFTLLEARPTILTMAACPSEKTLVSGTSTPQDFVLDAKSRNIKILFDAVSLSYAGNSKKKALRRVNMSIVDGQTVALVGPSGGGKSSTIALIERFFDPTEGSILLDGVDIREMDVKDLRKTMGLVSQEPDLFPGSISYNVKLGAAPGEAVTDEAVMAACKKCGLHDFITSLPDGYNTECGSSGTSKLSGGQRQRVAIARALVRDPQILLLDEPTSALDAHSEAQVQAALAAAARGRTTVVVAHRLASVQRADKIFVFDQGRVIASGTHAQLVQRCPLYASMAKAQSLG